MSCHFSCIHASDLVFNANWFYVLSGFSSRTKLEMEEKTLLQTFIYPKEISGSSLALLRDIFLYNKLVLFRRCTQQMMLHSLIQHLVKLVIFGIS